MIEATQRTSAPGTAGPVASPAAGGGGDQGSFGKTLEASLQESVGRAHAGEPVKHATRAKEKSQAAGEKRTGEHRASKAKAAAAIGVDGDAPEASVPATEGLTVVAEVVGVAGVQKLPGKVAALPGADAQDEVLGSAAAALPGAKHAAHEVSLGAEADVSGPTAKLVAASEQDHLAVAETVKAMSLSPGDSAPQISLAVQGVAGVAHVSAKQTAPAAAVKRDAEPAVKADEARVFEASSGVLEVGVANSIHGWLRVRAEVDEGGAVVAQVLASNAGAAEGLHKELPAMSAFLEHEQVGISSLVVHAPTNAAEAQDATSSFAQGYSGAGQSGRQEEKSSTALGLVESQPVMEDHGSGLSLALAFGGGGVLHGGWLSVRV